MSKTTIAGYLRQLGTNFKKVGQAVSGATPAVFPAIIQFTFSATQAAGTATGKFLPAGSVVIGVQNIDGGATGGASPTVDIGRAGTTDGFVNELDADDTTSLISTGTLIGVPLTVETEIVAGVGASAAAGGTVKAGVWYIMVDDGSRGAR